MFRVSYPDQVFETRATRRVARTVKDLLASPGATLALTGEIGAGKTVAAWNALRADDAKVIWCQPPDREHLTINTVISSMVRQLKGEDDGIRRDVECRLEQLRSLLGPASETGPVCLVIDDAHAVPLQLYRQLKRLMELHYAARKGLFSLLLIGNSEMQSRMAAVKEKFRRVRFLEVQKLSETEAAGLAKHAAARGRPAMDDAACDRIAKAHQNALDIASTIAAMQDQAWELNEPKVTVQMADAWLASTIRDLIDASAGTQRQAARAMGWSEGKMSRVLKGNYPNAEAERTRLLEGLATIRRDREPATAGVPS